MSEAEVWPDLRRAELVEGKLGDQLGVDRAVNKLIDAFATGGANRPSAWCTLPMLERKLAPLPQR